MKKKKVGIVGLGLIGGSFARAYKAACYTVYARDDPKILDKAKKFVNAQLDRKTLPLCDLILLAPYPKGAIEFLNEEARHIQSTTTVIDCCGMKKEICDVGFKAAEENGFTFVGGHPMAGTEYFGFEHSKANMFKGKIMFIVPPPLKDNIQFHKEINGLLKPAKFGKLIITKAEDHDKIIAYTSQMPHLINNAFVKNDIILKNEEFFGGSFKDMTRVARLNVEMWAELFLENKENLLHEFKRFQDSLQEYRDALEKGDGDKLKYLLLEGNRYKEEAAFE